jgi:crotonobetainyl-CoA:carnitine CoA-transferase CaiB-like acyl-CoA transferase
VAGCADLASDPRFVRNADRVRHRDSLVPLLAERLRQRPRAEWLAALDAAKVPCGPINHLGEVFEDPQVQARGMVQTVPHPHHPALPLVASPMKLSATPVQLRRPPPLLGQHSDEVLAEIGVPAQEVAALRALGVVGTQPPSAVARPVTPTAT